MKKYILQSIVFALCAVLISLPSHAQQWVQVGQDIDGEAADNRSGRSVSLSSDGSRVAIGAPYNDGNGIDAGHVRIYDWNGSSWVQLGQDIDGEAAVDYSGWSVSLSSDGSRVAIGAYDNDGNAGSNSGHVRIYDWNGSSGVWVQLGQDIDGEALENFSGWSVSLSSDGSRVAIGAPYNDGNGSQSGHVRIYDWNGSSWVQLGAYDIDGEAADDRSGYSVSLSSDGSRVAIGARYNDGNGSLAGHVRIYDWNGSAWLQLGQDIDGEAAYDWNGSSVSLSSDGSRVAIGAANNGANGSGSGHVRIYDWNGSSGVWVQLGQDIDGEAAYDYSGSSVSLSSDGSRVAIGASENDGNGNYSGHVRIYDWNGSSWVQVGQDIDGEAAGDISGSSVSLSSDGSLVAIGAANNGANGSGSGHVRVYTICNDSYATDVQTACDSYTWIDGNTYTSSTNTPTWTLSNAAGYDSVVTLDLTIDSINDNTASLSDSSLFANDSSASYQWLDCNANYSLITGETNQEFTPSASGTYAVEVTSNGCVDTSECIVFQMASVGVSESTFPTTISAYPNPFQRDLTVELGGNYSSISMRAYDILGKEVYSEDFYDTSILNAALDLPSGTYSIIISDDAGSEAELKVSVNQ